MQLSIGMNYFIIFVYFDNNQQLYVDYYIENLMTWFKRL